MRRFVFFAACLTVGSIAVGICGCSSKSDATSDNFAKVIDSDLLAKNVYLCSPDLAFPVKDGQNLRALWPDTFAALEALEHAGKVKSEMVPAADSGDALDKSGRVRSWTPVDERDPLFVHHMEPNLGASGKHLVGQYCYGKKRVEKVVKWEGPGEMGGSTIAIVYYTYRLDNLQSWALDPALKGESRQVRSQVDGQGKTLLTVPLVLTSEGWEVQGG
ncbi:hypothetical protein [Paraburkholderia megapolitana]|uniref:Lipoprotein n=1 Tax=Paraburkholderia megapolitana TaxID=420953 RepID=A0A1I3VVA9_9BURK|nr:hypothetical protein [Paraburkholderia megapolitana]QDQ82256.1 hypothetical protein FNZ07_13255 [Paraburkholderia megapolitana]SFJ99334.1 hypothetical protein SAMN05192543_1158 [Paraburkholderia megapolitana]